ncbi:LysR family transcriptional regulator [Ramlibacter sp. WS9]|uniref:LysR family transcriptional regulator n=1 Tax=Ramlibacter sp. WS9 TaxID=1882741 RepID=UPI001144394D|nr:LysR family transcriptional regulator [Ramlibacter sp. WS9]ROZ71490.1 LysR family transcriptional regulator [Ramlibacter sp. WS9]
MRELNLDQLRTLVAIADLGTFSAAAQALNLAQPTVSLHVSELESRLSAQLVLRGGRRVVPTPAGAVLVERARRLLREADDAVDTVRGIVAGRTGRVRLGTSTGILVYLLPQMLQAMAKSHPGVDVDVQIIGTYDGLAGIAAGTLDVALVAPPEAPGDLVVSRWRRDPMMALMPADWEAPQRVSPQWLAGKPLIFNDSTTRLYKQTMEWFGTAGIVPRVRIELNYNEAMKSLVAAGYGAAILPLEGPVAEHLVRGIQAVPLKPALARETVVVHRALPLLDGATRSVLEVLKRFKER